jgi:hypothetical protein
LFNGDEKLKELLGQSPLRMLHGLKDIFPVAISFHLRDLYLRRSLSFDAPQNEEAFRHINTPYLHEYLLNLMANKSEPVTLRSYGSALPNPTPYIKALLKYAALKKNLELTQIQQIATGAAEMVRVQEVEEDVARTRAKAQMEAGNYAEGFRIMVEMKSLDMVTQVGFEY